MFFEIVFGEVRVTRMKWVTSKPFTIIDLWWFDFFLFFLLIAMTCFIPISVLFERHRLLDFPFRRFLFSYILLFILHFSHPLFILFLLESSISFIVSSFFFVLDFNFFKVSIFLVPFSFRLSLLCVQLKSFEILNWLYWYLNSSPNFNPWRLQ